MQSNNFDYSDRVWCSCCKKNQPQFLYLSEKRVSEDDMIKPGCMVSGVVKRLTSHAIIIHVNAHCYSEGTLHMEHLADHQGHVALMKSFVKPGYRFCELLVLDVEGRNLILSAKHSLIDSVEQIPLEVTQIQPQTISHGYICEIIGSGCLVRFLGHLTGFCPINEATDDQRTDLSEAYYIGQSVRSKVLNVDGGSGKIKLSLKQSSCFSSDASFIRGYFLLEQEIAKPHIANSKDSGLNLIDRFSIGSMVEGVTQEANKFGVIIRFKSHDNVSGLINYYQMGGFNVEKGSAVQAAVLDISERECLVDLTLKPQFICSYEVSFSYQMKKKRRRKACNDLEVNQNVNAIVEIVKDLEVHQIVNAIVEIVKENYLVLSMPERNYAIGYASLNDYNTQKLPHKTFVHGQSVVATIAELPSLQTTGRLLLLLKSEASNSKKAKGKSRYNVGSIVVAEASGKC